MSRRLFAVMWDCSGLEAIANITDAQHRALMETLRTGERPQSLGVNLMHWRLRAQANQQRHYEIYLVDVVNDITENDIRDAFEASPQTMADTVRRIGHKWYSDRVDQSKVIIA
jgi:hypothetical protein